jgi:hypothetical protein
VVFAITRAIPIDRLQRMLVDVVIIAVPRHPTLLLEPRYHLAAVVLEGRLGQ